MQLIVIDSNPQGDDEIAPSEDRIIKIKVPQQVFRLVLIQPADLRVYCFDLGSQRFHRNRCACAVTRRPQKANLMRKFWAAVQILNFGLIRTVPSQTGIPATQVPQHVYGGAYGCKQEIIVVEDFPKAPFF